MTDLSTPPRITVAVIHHHIRGYAEDCLESLGAGKPQADTEYLLIGGKGVNLRQVQARFPDVRAVTLESGDRAAAKNLGIAESRGEFVLLVSADMLACPGAVGQLRSLLESRPHPTVVSAQLLSENGMRRRTAYPFPSLLRKSNPLGWLMRRLRALLSKRRPPAVGTVAKAEALSTSFLMARRETLREVGEFSEGYRFGYEDTEWCWRAAAKKIERCVLLRAHSFKLAPQLYGELPPPVRAAMAASLFHLVAATRGRAYGALFRSLLKVESFCKWWISGILNALTCGHSLLLRNELAVHKAIWTMPAQGPANSALAADVESHVRWEYEV